MLYSGKDKTLIETIAPGLITPEGKVLTEERLAFLGKLIGTTQDGSEVEKVAVVFFAEEEAKPFLDPCKRFGVECRAMQMSTGGEVVLVEGARTRKGSSADKGVLLPVFREAKWPHLTTVVHRPLFNQPAIEGPWVTFAEDLGSQLARLNPAELQKRTLEQIEAEALANLSKRTFTPELRDGVVLLQDEYAPEALLLGSVRAEILKLLGGPPLFLAAAGQEGRVIAAPPAPNPGIIQVAEMMFRDAKGRRISPLPFLVDASGIVGFASIQPKESSQDAPAAKEKPWWKFW